MSEELLEKYIVIVGFEEYRFLDDVGHFDIVSNIISRWRGYQPMEGVPPPGIVCNQTQTNRVVSATYEYHSRQERCALIHQLRLPFDPARLLGCDGARAFASAH